MSIDLDAVAAGPPDAATTGTAAATTGERDTPTAGAEAANG